ncbi:uncharacterized protein Tco025E_08098, partial [Trypanosoma conorhini]
ETLKREGLLSTTTAEKRGTSPGAAAVNGTAGKALRVAGGPGVASPGKKGLAMWAPQELSSREGGRNVRVVARERRPKMLGSWAPSFLLLCEFPEGGGGIWLGCGLPRRMRSTTLPPAQQRPSE